MANLARGSSISITLKDDDSITISGVANYTVTTLVGQKSQTSYVSGTNQVIGPFKQIVTVTINADTACTYTVSSVITSTFSNSLSRTANRGYGVVISDSRGRRAITATGSITTIASYDALTYAKAFSLGKLKTYAIAGNSGYDIGEALAIIDTAPPCNASSSTGSGAVTEWGLRDVDLTQCTFAYIHLGINHFSDFNFTSTSPATREATNSIVRASIINYARQLLAKLSALPIVVWQTEGAVGPAVVNFNGGDTSERGYIWHLKWFNQMLNDLTAEVRNLQILDTTDILSDSANAQFIAKQYLTLSTDGTQANQDMHETHYAYRLIGQRLWSMVSPYINSSVPMGLPLFASDKIGVDKSSYNVYPDSLLVGSTVTAKVLYGGGNSTTAPVTDANISGVMYPEMSAQANITAGQATIVCKKIACPSGFGNAIQVDFTATADLDASFGFSLYNVGVAINAAISSGYMTFNEAKVIQACAYFKAGLAGGSDGLVVDTNALRQVGFNLRVRTTVNNQFDTATTYGASNASTDYSTNSSGLQQAGQFTGVLTTPCMKIDGVTTSSPNQMQTRTMASPNTSEYMYLYAVSKVLTGQTMRVIIGNVGVYVAPMRADGLIPDII